MNNAELILKIQDEYDSRTREEILVNLNVAVALGASKGLEVDRYRALPIIVNRSKHTVMSWFNRPDKKIPLVDLCMIADYLNYNIFAFFEINNSCTAEDASSEQMRMLFAKLKKGKPLSEKEQMLSGAVGNFLIANEQCNEKYPPDSAKIFLRAYNLRYDLDKNKIIDNLEKYYPTSEELLQHHSNERKLNVMEICACNRHTYTSWFNRSRTNVRIPLDSLCKLAIAANVDIFDLLKE